MANRVAYKKNVCSVFTKITTDQNKGLRVLCNDCHESGKISLEKSALRLLLKINIKSVSKVIAHFAFFVNIFRNSNAISDFSFVTNSYGHKDNFQPKKSNYIDSSIKK